MKNTRLGLRMALCMIAVISSLAVLNGCAMKESTGIPDDQQLFSFPVHDVPVTEDVYNPSVTQDVYSPDGEQLDTWQ
ncbi:hypothetical protein [Paenibacillus sp. SN-8-1]|uniref:hypothetical protein n=1 Tax=Paenibacillus sp. SN-8-1 TaxID=3435409 RepID=UPI003D9A91CF